MLTYNANSNTGTVCGGRAPQMSIIIYSLIFPESLFQDSPDDMHDQMVFPLFYRGSRPLTLYIEK